MEKFNRETILMSLDEYSKKFFKRTNRAKEFKTSGNKRKGDAGTYKKKDASMFPKKANNNRLMQQKNDSTRRNGPYKKAVFNQKSKRNYNRSKKRNLITSNSFDALFKTANNFNKPKEIHNKSSIQPNNDTTLIQDGTKFLCSGIPARNFMFLLEQGRDKIIESKASSKN